MDPSARAWRERVLLDAVLGGDEQAWRTWYEESFDDLYAYLLWRAGGLRDVADELVQETWLTALRRLRDFDPAQGSFAGWLRGIAARLLNNHFRRQRRQRRARPLADVDLADEQASAEAGRREQAECVARALAALPGHYEAVLRAKYLEGQSVAQIAAAGGETEKAVESLLTRARQAFRQAYLDPE